MSKTQDNKRRMKQLKKLKKLCVNYPYASPQKLLIVVVYNFSISLISYLIGCIFIDKAGILNKSIIYQFLWGFSISFMILGSWLILTKCDFDDFYFNKAKKILDNYQPIHKKKYDYFINNFNENSWLFWERLDKFIELENETNTKRI